MPLDLAEIYMCCGGECGYCATKFADHHNPIKLLAFMKEEMTESPVLLGHCALRESSL